MCQILSQSDMLTIKACKGKKNSVNSSLDQNYEEYTMNLITLYIQIFIGAYLQFIWRPIK